MVFQAMQQEHIERAVGFVYPAAFFSSPQNSRLRAFPYARKNIFKFLCPEFGNFAFSSAVSIEGKKYPTGREARRPFPGQQHIRLERDAGLYTTEYPMRG